MRKNKETGVWEVKVRTAGGNRYYKSLGTRTKSVAEDIARKMKDDEVRKKAGVIDRFSEHRKRPILAHLADFRKSLESDNSSHHHVRTTYNRCEQIIKACGFKFVGELTPSAIKNHLARRRNESKRFGLASTNHYITSIKSFTNWMVKDGRLAPVEDPLVYLTKLDADSDVRRPRRASSAVEVARLLLAARAGKEPFSGRSPEPWCLAGRDREALYLVAVATGFRADELASLTPESFRLAGDRPHVIVEAAETKNGSRAVQHVPAEIARFLTAYLAEKAVPAGRRVWPGLWNDKAATMLRVDQEAAGIPPETADGHADFHALRATGITFEYNRTKDPKATQVWARHSTINLTMEVYMSARHLGDEDTLDNVVAFVTGRKPLPRRPGEEGAAQGQPDQAADRPALPPAQTAETGGGREADGPSERKSIGEGGVRYPKPYPQTVVSGLEPSSAVAVGEECDPETPDAKAQHSQGFGVDCREPSFMGRAGIEPATHGFSVHCSTN